VESWPVDRKRRVVAGAVARHRDRGTRAGLRAYLELATGGDVQVRESGGTLWSDDPAVAPPGDPVPGLAIVLRIDDPSAVDTSWLRSAVREARPAHLPFSVEVTGPVVSPPTVPGQRVRTSDPTSPRRDPRGGSAAG
jgi:hypothetical protein